MLSCARRSARSVGGDLRVELGEVERLLAQPRDDVALGEPVLALVVELDRDDGLALGGQLGEDLGLQPPHEAAPPQVPVDALLGADAAEAAREAGRPSRSRSSRPMIRSWEIELVRRG